MAPVSVADPPGLRMATLVPWLAHHVSGIHGSGPIEARLLAGGRSNVTYLLTQGDTRLVLRRPPLGHVMASAHDMAREARILRGLHSVSFPVPEVYALCADAAVIGADFQIMEFVPGVTVADAGAAAQVSPAAADQLCARFVATLARLHAVDVVAAGLTGLGRPDGYLHRQVTRWEKQWRTTATRDLPAVEHLLSWLTRAVPSIPANLPWALVHGDYRVDNVILSGFVAPDIRAVVDWEMGTLGDPILDLAVACVYWSRPGETLRRRVAVADGVTDGAGFWSRDELISRYQELTGFGAEHFVFCLTLACLKLAVIMESIARRTREGRQLGAPAELGVDMTDAAEALAEMGLAVIAADGVAGLSA